MIASAENAVAFTKDGVPKLLASVSSLSSDFAIESGSTDFTRRGVLISGSEAKMMREERPFKQVGEVPPDFFGATNIFIMNVKH